MNNWENMNILEIKFNFHKILGNLLEIEDLVINQEFQ